MSLTDWLTDRLTDGIPYSLSCWLAAKKDDILIMNNEDVKFVNVTHKHLYETAIHQLSRFHHSEVKWFIKLNSIIRWPDVWETVHNFLSANKTKTIIWQQIHLNFYTQYSYNKWHKANLPCTAHKIPQDIYHIIVHCDVVNNVLYIQIKTN